MIQKRRKEVQKKVNPFEKTRVTDLNVGVKQQDIGVVTYSGDNNSNKIGVLLFKGNLPQDITGTVIGKVIRMDGATVEYQGYSEGNLAYILLTESAFAYPGRLEIKIRIIDGDQKMVIADYVAKASRTETGKIIDPGHVVPDVDDVIAKQAEIEQAINDANDAAENANAAASHSVRTDTNTSLTNQEKETARNNINAVATSELSDDYNPDTGATAGKYYIHAGAWYLCLEDTTGEWDGTKFRKKQVGNEVSDLKSAIDEDEDGIISEELIVKNASNSSTWEMGTISTKTGADSSSTSRIRTKESIPDTVVIITAKTGFLTMVAYESSTFKGVWTGDGFVVGVTASSFTTMNMETIKQTYPTYSFRLVWGKSNYTPVPSTDYAQIDIISPNYVSQAMTEIRNDIETNKDNIDKINDNLLATELPFIDYSTASVWEGGSINSSTGANSSSTSRMRIIDYIPDTVNSISTVSGYVYLFAYEGSTYKGVWTGSDFSTSGGTYLSSINLANIKSSYPTYKYRLIWLLANHNPVPSTDYVNVKILSPGDPVETEIVTYKNRVNNLVEVVDDGTEPTGVIGMFEKWAVIGTSYDCGVMYLPDGTAAGNPYMGWEHQLARRYGNTQVRLAAGGMRTNLWLNVPDNKTTTIPAVYHDYNLTRLEAIGSTLDLVMITLGCNDISHASETGIGMGSISDIVSEFPSTIASGQTFAYYYSVIICAVREYAPQAKIICCHSFLKTSSFNAAYNALIDEIAEEFGLPVIEQEKDVYFKGAYHDNAMLYTHPIGANYSGIATAYDRMISDCVYNNYNSFKDYVGGGDEPEPVAGA